MSKDVLEEIIKKKIEKVDLLKKSISINTLNAAAGLIVSEKHTIFIDAYNEARTHILSGITYNDLKEIQNV